MDDPTVNPAPADNPPAPQPQVSPAPPAVVPPAPVAATQPQFDPQKWEHMLKIASPEDKARMLGDLGGVSSSQYLADNKAILCSTLGIPEDKQYLVSGSTVAELTKAANDVAALLKPAGNPPAADNPAPSAPPATPPAPVVINPPAADTAAIKSVDDAVDAYKKLAHVG